MHMLFGAMFSLIIGFFSKRSKNNPVLKKAYRDLRAHPGRSLLAVFALALGLWGAGSILVSYTILKNDLNRNFAMTNPMHAAFVSDDFERFNINEFRKRPEIESAEFRDLKILRVEAFEDKWLPLLLYGVEDFNDMHLAQIFHEEGPAQPESNTIFIERDAQHFLVSNLKTGSLAKIRSGGETILIPVSGIFFDPAQAPATQDAFIYAYADKNTFRQISKEKTNRRLIVRFRGAQTKEDVLQNVKHIQDDFAKNRIELESVRTPKFNEHPHQFQLNTLLMTNGIIGFLAFLLGAVLVSQLMQSILSQQIRQIGILKAIGATNRQIFSVYLTMVFLLGIVSGTIAIPLAVAAGYGYAGFVAGIINFNILTVTLPHGVYAGLILAALFLPVLFSLPALRKGTQTSVYQALCDYGISGNAGKEKPDRNAAKWPLPVSFVMAIRNIFRRKQRLAISVATLALGVAIFNTGFNVRQSLADFLQENRESMKYDVQVVFREAIDKKKAFRPFANLANLKSAEYWNGGKGRLQSNVISTFQNTGVVALPYDTGLRTWEIIKGRPLQPGMEILMNQQAYETFGYPPLNEKLPITIRGKTFALTLTGVIKEFDIAKIYIDKDTFNRLYNPGDLINSILFTAENNSYNDVIEFKKNIERMIESSNLPVLYVMSQAERAKIIYDHLNIILTILTFLALLVLIVGALGMASSTGITILERTREIGVLRAIGASPSSIFKMFVLEGLLVVVFGIIGGMILAWPLSILAANYFGYLILGAHTPLAAAFSLPGFIITLSLTLLFGWAAGRLPANQAIRVSARDALAYE